MIKLPIPIFYYWHFIRVCLSFVLINLFIDLLIGLEYFDEMSWIRIVKNSIIISCLFALIFCCLMLIDAFGAVGIALRIMEFSIQPFQIFTTYAIPIGKMIVYGNYYFNWHMFCFDCRFCLDYSCCLDYSWCVDDLFMTKTYQ